MNQNFDIKIGNRIAKVRIINENDNLVDIEVDGKLYKIDIIPVDAGYSIIYNNKSYNVEIIESENSKELVVNTMHHSFDVDIVDAEYRYIESRLKAKMLEGSNIISSPMPGRVVKILVSEGQEVELGQPVIIVSAMKMDSEYKSGKNGKVKQIHVKEGDVINGHQPLITIE